MKKTKKILTVFLIVTIVSLVAPTTAMAMSSGPQMMTIVIVNAPKDLEISIVHEKALGESYQARVSNKLWETYYRFSLSEEFDSNWLYEEITILIKSEMNGEFERTFPVPRGDFTLKLDLETRTVTQPYTHGRNAIIALCWLIPLIVIDGIVFLLFGYRKKQSWKIFVLENPVMHGLFVGIWSLFHIINSNFFILLLILFVPFILLPGVRIVKLAMEISLFRGAIKEHSESRATVCAVVMNIVGTIVVILLGMHLPFPAL